MKTILTTTLAFLVIAFSVTFTSCSKDKISKSSKQCQFLGTLIGYHNNGTNSYYTAYVKINGVKKALNNLYDVKTGDKLEFYDTGNITTYTTIGTMLLSTEKTQGSIIVDNVTVKNKPYGSGTVNLIYIVP